MTKAIRILSWNVNGIRAVIKKDFLEWLYKSKPDILCVQETKADPGQLTKAVLEPKGYYSYWDSSIIKKGYSGVATFSKEKPLKIERGLGIEKFDQEGRVLMTEFKEFILFNVYFPNGKANSERLNFKLEFYEAFLKHIDLFKKKGKKIIFCGDVNTAHKAIDLARPKENEAISGFLPIEREWINRVIKHGYLDTLREFHSGPGLYTWWSQRTRARERNVGWRIDYFFIQNELRKFLKDAYILPDVAGSDHCPIAIELELRIKN